MTFDHDMLIHLSFQVQADREYRGKLNSIANESKQEMEPFNHLIQDELLKTGEYRCDYLFK